MKQNLNSILKVVSGILKTENKFGNFVPLNLLQKETKMSKNKIKPILEVLIDEKFIVSPKEEFYLRVK